MRRSVHSTLNIGLATAVVGLLLRYALGSPHFESMLAVPFGILFGIPGVVGFALGTLLSRSVAAGLGVGNVVRVAGDLLLATGGYVLWGDRTVPTAGGDRRKLATALVRYLLVATVALLATTGIQAFGGILGHRMSFATSVVVVLSERTLPTLLLGPVVLLSLATIGFRNTPIRPTSSVRPSRLLGASLVIGGWLATGFLLSVVHEDVVSPTGIDRGVVLDVFPALLRPLVAFSVGSGYYTTLYLASFVAVLVAATLLFRDSRSGS